MKPSPLARLLVGILRGYQRHLSPFLGRRCRFYPTCSAYAIEAIQRRGAVIGTAKAVWRVMRCNPFHPGGYDPVVRQADEGDGPRQSSPSEANWDRSGRE